LHQSASASPESRTFHDLVAEPFREDVRVWEGLGYGPRDGGRLRTLLLAARYAGVRAIALHRLAYWTRVNHVPGASTVLVQLNIMLHGIDIVASVPIGPGAYIPHPVGIVINAMRIGSHVTLQGGITVGLRTDRRFPIVEDGVTLGAGCRVLGPVTVGERATVGANAVVLDDVEPETTVVGVPARPVRRSDTSASAG